MPGPHDFLCFVYGLSFLPLCLLWPHEAVPLASLVSQYTLGALGAHDFALVFLVC